MIHAEIRLTAFIERCALADRLGEKYDSAKRIVPILAILDLDLKPVLPEYIEIVDGDKSVRGG